MSIDRPNYWIWQDANSNQSIASRRDYRMNNQKSPLHGTALRAARSGRLSSRSTILMIKGPVTWAHTSEVFILLKHLVNMFKQHSHMSIKYCDNPDFVCFFNWFVWIITSGYGIIINLSGYLNKSVSYLWPEVILFFFILGGLSCKILEGAK